MTSSTVKEMGRNFLAKEIPTSPAQTGPVASNDLPFKSSSLFTCNVLATVGFLNKQDDVFNIQSFLKSGSFKAVIIIGELIFYP